MRYVVPFGTSGLQTPSIAFALSVAAAVSGCTGGSADSTEAALWCEEHGVEEKYCVLCHPEIRENSDLLLCPEHGNIPEAICTACHPELKEKYESCPHDLPTAFCPKCSPEFAATLKDGDAAGHGHGEHDHDHDHGHDHGSEGDES